MLHTDRKIEVGNYANEVFFEVRFHFQNLLSSRLSAGVGVLASPFHQSWEISPLFPLVMWTFGLFRFRLDCETLTSKSAPDVSWSGDGRAGEEELLQSPSFPLCSTSVGAYGGEEQCWCDEGPDEACWLSSTSYEKTPEEVCRARPAVCWVLESTCLRTQQTESDFYSKKNTTEEPQVNKNTSFSLSQ